jgi:Zn-dependent protease
MENDAFLPKKTDELNGANNEAAGDSLIANGSPMVYPPKPEIEDKKGNVWLRSLSSLALYLLLGYYFFHANWPLLLILTAVVVFHELGHFLAMKIYGYKDLGIFFIPLLGAYASGTKREVSQKQSAIILLAGPLPGIIIGLVLYFLCTHSFANNFSIDTTMRLLATSKLLIFLNLLNLLPIYPLDGGQLLNKLFIDETQIIGKIFVVLSALALGYFAVHIGFYPLLVFPLMMLLRMFSDSSFDRLTKTVESEGINLEKSYEDISDEEYWKIRNILIEKNYGPLRNISPSPPYEYSPQEDRVVTAIQNLLQRTIIEDLSWAGKAFIILICLACFAAPFLLHIELPFFGRL